MPLRQAHINIGSNLGCREAMLRRAIDALRAEFGAVEVSSPVESPAWGYSSPFPYLNAGINFHTELSPSELLHRLLAIQHAIDPRPHRAPDGSYLDRAIDIDLIALDDLQSLADPELPHPRMHLREFVLRPMIQIWPRWRHPVLGLTAAEILAGHT